MLLARAPLLLPPRAALPTPPRQPPPVCTLPYDSLSAAAPADLSFASLLALLQQAYTQLPLPDEQKPLPFALGAAAVLLYSRWSRTLPAPDPTLLDGTILEGRSLRRVYKASVDGWGAADFHRKVDAKGPAVVVAASGRSIVGGFNPRGWASLDDYLNTNNAFVFARDGQGPWQKMRKVGGEAAVFDYARAGPQFGSEALIVGASKAAVMGGFTGPDMMGMEAAGNLRRASSVLGYSYERGPPPFRASLFGGGKLEARLREVEVWCAEEDKAERPPRQKTTEYWKRF